MKNQKNRTMKNKKIRNRILAATLAFVMAATTAFAQPQQAEAEEVTPPIAPNTTFDTARELQFGTSIAEELSSGDTKRYYKFTIREASVMDLGISNITNDRANFKFIVYDKSRTAVYNFEAGWRGAFDIKNIILTGGEYYLGLEQSYSSGNRCSHSMIASIAGLGESFTETQDSNNDSIDTASPVSFGKKYKGVMACNDDKDYYRFSVPAEGKVTVNLTNSTSNTVKCSIYDSGSNLSATDTWQGNSKAAEGTCPLIKGTYYLVIAKNDNDAAGSYTFTLSYVRTTAKKTSSSGTTTSAGSSAKAPSLSGVKNKSSKKMTVSWKKVSGAAGYQVQYSLKKSFKSGVKKRTIQTANTTKTTFSKLKKRKKYYVRVRAYRVVNGSKKYGKWSKIKSVKIRK